MISSKHRIVASVDTGRSPSAYSKFSMSLWKSLCFLLSLLVLVMGGSICLYWVSEGYLDMADMADMPDISEPIPDELP